VPCPAPAPVETSAYPLEIRDIAPLPVAILPHHGDYMNIGATLSHAESLLTPPGHLHGLRAAPRAPPAATLEGLDVVPGLRLVGPRLDLGLADLVLTHGNIVNENRAVREDAVRGMRRSSWCQVGYSSAMRIMVLESAQMTASLVFK